MFLSFDIGTSRRIESFAPGAARAEIFATSRAAWRRLAFFEKEISQ
jgi:hypothetical protein